MRVRSLLTFVIVAAGQSACDPCTGVANCDSGAYLAVDGRIVDPITGAGLDGVRIDVIRVGGVALEVDSMQSVTKDGGHWRVEFKPRTAGSVEVDVVVSPPGFASYRVPSVSLQTRARGGDANVLDPWVPEPYFSYAAEFYRIGTADERIDGALVEFRRTGGVALRGSGIQGGAFRGSTDVAGRITIFPTRGNAVFPVTFGDVVGDFLVSFGPTNSTSVVRDVRLTPTPVYRQQRSIVREGVGPGAP